MWVPKPGSQVVEAIEFASSHETSHDANQIDKKTCLFVMYDSMLWSFPYFPAQPFILVSPMRRVGAARIAFNCDNLFEWTGWDTRNEDGPKIDTSCIAIGNHFWTRYVKGTIVELIF